MRQKLFVGPQVRLLREEKGLRLEACGRALGISVSYLSQIEANLRPVTPRVMAALVEVFEVAPETFEADADLHLMAHLREAAAETSPGQAIALRELRAAALYAPALARRFLELHRDNHRLTERLRATDEAVALDEESVASLLLPYEEVRDFFHYKNNYIDALDRAAEALAAEIRLMRGVSAADVLRRALEERFRIRVELNAEGDLMRRYDPARRELSVNPAQAPATRAFQMAFQLTTAAFAELIEAELDGAQFRSRAAVEVCRTGLGNYAAGALLMPYGEFARAARETRHDVELLAHRFGASLEQVCHRLSTLQRPGERGVPLYFVRLDYAGNITKRHSATRFQFARFGGACPMWNVHEAVNAPERFLVQVAETPDGARYLCVARNVVKSAYSYLTPHRRYVLGFGCEIEHASEFVYAEGVDLKGPATPIGASCRICERDNCQQRAFPPVDRKLKVWRDERRTVPYELSAANLDLDD